MSAVSGVVPGAVFLARLDPGETRHRVIEVGGDPVEGLRQGAHLPALAEGIDPDGLRLLGFTEWIETPLVVSNGHVVGGLCAAGVGAGAFAPEHEAQLAVAARLLAHEFESVEMRSRLRRLRGLTNAGPTTDPATGLPNRDSFVELLDHEWQLAQRGTVQSMLLTFRVEEQHGGTNGTPGRTSLAVKLAAEVLEGTTRETDRVGRVGDATLAAILIGCRPPDTPSFVARFMAALERVSGEGAPSVEVACGLQPLDAASSPEEVLGLAEAAAVQQHAPARMVSLGAAVE